MSEEVHESASEVSMGAGHGNAICYSGYREGQSPRTGVFPSYDEIREDLELLAGTWKFLRLYDAGPHAETVLEVIREHGLPFRVMLGLDVAAEVSNENCPWGGVYPDEILRANREANERNVQQLIDLANRYPTIVPSISVGNEAAVEWTDHMVPVERLVDFVRRIRSATGQRMTFCENYETWTTKLDSLAAELDFISLHTYPVWEYKTIEEALEYTRQNYQSVVDRHPGKPVIITEAGWTTASNGRGIEPWNASEELQAAYYAELMEWTTGEQILTFVFEAFDEPWKGSDDPLDPEKHWGLYRVDRTPKPVLQK